MRVSVHDRRAQVYVVWSNRYVSTQGTALGVANHYPSHDGKEDAHEGTGIPGATEKIHYGANLRSLIGLPDSLGRGKVSGRFLVVGAKDAVGRRIAIFDL